MAQHILLIDDDKYSVDLLSGFLQEKGYRVSTAANGKKGMAIFGTERIDLIVTDILMPEKDGVEVIIELKLKMKSSVPIVAISEETLKSGMPIDLLFMAREFGADCTLMKPFSNSVFLSCVKDLLSLSEYNNRPAGSGR